ncbi:hypothetical protein TELCIR_13665, partial [Teladorsagia circumcincta]
SSLDLMMYVRHRQGFLKCSHSFTVNVILFPLPPSKSVCQFHQRKCLLENDVHVYKSLYEGLLEFQKRLDTIWNKSRWISRIASEAREKRISPPTKAIPLSRFLTPIERRPSEDSAQKTDTFVMKAEDSGCSQKGSPEPLMRPLRRIPTDLDW